MEDRRYNYVSLETALRKNPKQPYFGILEQVFKILLFKHEIIILSANVESYTFFLLNGN